MDRKNTVFITSIILTLIFIIWGVFFTDNLAKVTDTIYQGSIDYLGWVYVGATFFFVIFSVYLLFSKYGDIRLGKKTDRPDFNTGSWLAMLFGAGMGIGIVYWSVAEPVTHYTKPPYGEGYTIEAANTAMKYTFFHWGLHPWAIYTVIGLALAFFQYNKKLPASISSAFYPVLGDRIYGPIGKTIDILSIFATVFGIATSLGLGAMQVTAGMHDLFGVPNELWIQLIVIIVATVLFMISVNTGLEKGIQYLSNAAMIFSFAIMLLILIVGPTLTTIKVFFNTTGLYINDFIHMSLRLKPFGEGEWIASWTLFYWAWWIAWAPFVGMFIARVSKGRTIREFVIGVLIAPTLGTCLWMSIFGGSALKMVQDAGNSGLAEFITKNISLSIFTFFDHLPLSSVLSIFGFAVIAIYYITVADTATFVLGMLSEGGTLNPSNKIKMTWGVIQSAVAAVLLLAGGLNVLQTASIAAALPFAIIMVIMCYSLLKGLKSEAEAQRSSKRTRQHA
ncbi:MULTISPECIES: BCCT family transporter [Neobacillus]|jgi:glycine betaine transporter|uniref:BCCT family transporter n=1 Tax=Neobacillus sedimentimangrovi TaxID=2699460 RepID=A0ABS8QDZ8_9BACI|nr:BCCT family transporter [Neobacillus sedimentimangrovi]AIM16901.1 glycine/betaine ABC transporter permease [Bacillus sp. X1(2014)]MCD4837488.1 BCCT family transporter [Neobacillus sedimentimangrovi]